MTEAGATTEQTEEIGLSYPAGVFSLSHLALPFPMNDSLYGLRPEGEPEFGVELGALAARGERGALIISPELLMRMTSNPFYPFTIARIEAGIPAPAQEAGSTSAKP